MAKPTRVQNWLFTIPLRLRSLPMQVLRAE